VLGVSGKGYTRLVEPAFDPAEDMRRPSSLQTDIRLGWSEGRAQVDKHVKSVAATPRRRYGEGTTAAVIAVTAAYSKCSYSGMPVGMDPAAELELQMGSSRYYKGSSFVMSQSTVLSAVAPAVCCQTGSLILTTVLLAVHDQPLLTDSTQRPILAHQSSS
jgi:hypothetical protein